MIDYIEVQYYYTPEYNLEQLINEMMESDLKLVTKDQYLKDGGYTIMNYFEYDGKGK